MEIDRLATPAFLYIDNPGVGRNGHAIALVAQESNGRYLIIDPLAGKVSWSRDQLLEIWHGLSVSCTRKKYGGNANVGGSYNSRFTSALWRNLPLTMQKL
jgi:hypothetical protein